MDQIVGKYGIRWLGERSDEHVRRKWGTGATKPPTEVEVQWIDAPVPDGADPSTARRAPESGPARLLECRVEARWAHNAMRVSETGIDGTDAARMAEVEARLLQKAVARVDEPAEGRSEREYVRGGPVVCGWEDLTRHHLTASGLWVPDIARPGRRPTAVSLFTGAGGFDLGMTLGGVRILAGVERDPDAALTYLTNQGAYPISLHFPEESDELRFERAVQRESAMLAKKAGASVIEVPIRSGMHRPRDREGTPHFWFGDIRKIKVEDMLSALALRPGDLDCVFGGPPCQGLSTGNPKACVEDPRNGLLWEFLRIVEGLRPAGFLIENVPQLLSAAKGGLYDALARRATGMGYTVVANILDAANYGAPQLRRRAFVVGMRGTKWVDFPIPTCWPIGDTTEGRSWRKREERVHVTHDDATGTFRAEEVGGERPKKQARESLDQYQQLL